MMRILQRSLNRCIAYSTARKAEVSLRVGFFDFVEEAPERVVLFTIEQHRLIIRLRLFIVELSDYAELMTSVTILDLQRPTFWEISWNKS